MIANAILQLLKDPMRSGGSAASRRSLDAAIEESLRLEPAAAVVDRYATAGHGARRDRDRARRPRPPVDRAANRDPDVSSNRIDST